MKANNIMKRLSILLIPALALILGFSACSKDKDPEPKEEEISLDGKWIATDTKVEYYFDKKLVETESNVKNAWDYIIFDKNEGLLKQQGQLAEIAIITLTKNTLIFKSKVNDRMFDFEYAISGNELTLVQTNNYDGNTPVGNHEFNSQKVIRYSDRE